MKISPGINYHEATKHSWLSVRQNPNRLDWDNRPSFMKVYPSSLTRVKLQTGSPAHDFIYRIGGITAKKSYPTIEYYLRTNPSAGALYPNEIYFQTRGVDGFLDAVYHFEVATSSATILYELKKEEGIESILGVGGKVDGFIFFISSVYYRSAWKYRNRAYRYTLLDAGHILGAIEAASSVYDAIYKVFYCTNLEEINSFFGFKKEEFFLSTAVVGKLQKNRSVRPPKIRLKQTDPAGVFKSIPLIEEAYLGTIRLVGCKSCEDSFFYPFKKDVLKKSILSRRSAREFLKKSLAKNRLETILNIVDMPTPCDCDEPLTVYYIVNRVDGLKPGVYVGRNLIKEGDYSKKCAYLCLQQRLGSDSAVTFFITSSARNYRALYQKAGIIGHRIYISSNCLGIGCSGIGAYYDDEVREFLGEKGMILYAVAIG